MADSAELPLVSELEIAGIDTIEAGEPVRTAQRRMEAQTLRSLIVVEGDRPVGVVQWRDLRGADAESPIEGYMTRDFPVLRRDMRLDEAHSRLGEIDFDTIPVIDEEGRLVGAVPRGAVVHHEMVTDEADHVAADGAPVTTPETEPSWDIREDMEVVDDEGGKLGTITEVLTDPTTHRLAHFDVQHGMLRKKHKRLPVDTVIRVDGDQVVLGIGKREFGYLSDIEDQDM